ITGAATVAGTYTVTVTVSDGHGGTDSDNFAWHVLPPSGSMPLALIDLDIDSFSIVLVHPSDSVVAHVYLYNPGDPSAALDVNLEVSPSGRSVVNTPEIAMHHDDWATVTIYPQAVNQEVDDVLVKALVNGLETSRLELTNAGIVLPERVRGPNTPEGMIDRI